MIIYFPWTETGAWMIQSTKINENNMEETIQEIINKGNLKVATDLTNELQQLIDKESKSGKPLCSKTRRKSIIGILAEKLKDIECVDISVRFNQDK